MPMIDIEKIYDKVRSVYEGSSKIKIFQESLEGMINVIDKIGLDYSRGKISKRSYEVDMRKFKVDSIRLIKDINQLIDMNIKHVKIISGEVLSNRAPQKAARKSGKAARRAV